MPVSKYDVIPVKVKNGFVVGSVYVRMVRAGIRTFYNIYDYRAKKNVMLNVFYKNSAFAIAEAHNKKSELINKLKEMEEEYSKHYVEMTHFRYMHNKTKDDNRREVFSVRFDEHQQKCIAIRNQIDTFICDPSNNFQCSEVINNNK